MPREWPHGCSTDKASEAPTVVRPASQRSPLRPGGPLHTCLVIQTSHRLASLPDNERWDQGAAKAAICKLAQNKHCPGRNDTLEGGEHLAESSDRLKHAQEPAGMAPRSSGCGQGSWRWQTPQMMSAAAS